MAGERVIKIIKQTNIKQSIKIKVVVTDGRTNDIVGVLYVHLFVGEKGIWIWRKFMD